MYYLNLHELYKPTIKKHRIEVRQTLNRNRSMQNALKKQKYMCFYCGLKIDMSAHLDHLVPVYYGGDNRLRNLVASCKSCNLTKSTDQIEITNEYTIKDYKNKIRNYIKWQNKLKKYPYLSKYKPKEVILYEMYHCELFKEL